MLSRPLNDDTRQIGIAISQFLCFGIITAGFALRNQPNAVEYFGAAITIIVLLQITSRRNTFLDAAAAREKEWHWTYLKHREEKDKHRDEALHLTFDLHMVQIAQMCAELELPCPMSFISSSANACGPRSVSWDIQRRMPRRAMVLKLTWRHRSRATWTSDQNCPGRHERDRRVLFNRHQTIKKQRR